MASFELGCQLVAIMGENSEGRYFTSHFHWKYGLARYTSEFWFHSVNDTQLNYNQKM